MKDFHMKWCECLKKFLYIENFHNTNRNLYFKMNQNITLEISWASFANTKLLIQLPDDSSAMEIINLCYHKHNFNKESNNANSQNQPNEDKEYRLCNKSNISPILIHDGKVLNLSLSLKFQNVKNNDLIIIYEKKTLASSNQSLIMPSNGIENDFSNDKLNQSLMLEALFHRDRYFKNLEIDRRALLTYNQLFESQQQALHNWKQQLQTQLQQHPQQPIQFVFQLGEDSNDFFLDIFGFGFNNNFTCNGSQNRGFMPDQPTKIPKKMKEVSVKPLPLLCGTGNFPHNLDQHNEDIINCDQNEGNVVHSIDNTQKCLSEHSCNWKW